MYWGHADNIKTMKQTYPHQKFIFAPSDFYYMDCGMGNKYGENTFCNPFKTFWTLYSFEPSEYLDDGSVLGGELPAWSELNTPLNIHPKLWPRGGAMSDKLWGELDPNFKIGDLVKRLNAFKTKLS